MPGNLTVLAKGVKDILRPFGHADVLLYYALVAERLKKFLKGREISTKIWLPHGNMPFFLKRGSKLQPLYAKDLAAVDWKMLKMRAESPLSKVKGQLTKKQALIWEYFVPRKLMDFFYACNKEGQGKPIDRIFIDIDKGKGIKPEIAQEVTRNLVHTIKKDKKFNRLLKYETFIMWTGSSFHIYLFLNKKIGADFYNKYIAYSKKNPFDSFIGRWAQEISRKTGINVQGGHEKSPDAVNLDPSQTPSGKLARCPFSLHMKSPTETDGIALPITEKQLGDKKLTDDLNAYTPKQVIKELDKFSKILEYDN